MQNAQNKMCLVLVGAVAFVALAITPALAKDSQKKKASHSSAKAAGHGPDHSDVPKTSHQMRGRDQPG